MMLRCYARVVSYWQASQQLQHQQQQQSRAFLLLSMSQL
jgi:hypothetical protein